MPAITRLKPIISCKKALTLLASCLSACPLFTAHLLEFSKLSLPACSLPSLLGKEINRQPLANFYLLLNSNSEFSSFCNKTSFRVMCHVKLWHYGSLNFLYFMEVHCAVFFFIIAGFYCTGSAFGIIVTMKN